MAEAERAHLMADHPGPTQRIVPREKYIGAVPAFLAMMRPMFRQPVRRDWRTYYVKYDHRLRGQK